MARAFLLALTCAAAASAARYVDYSGVKMPVYGAGDYDAPREPAAAPQSDDYRGHSPDAPASLDYKYEEEPRIKTEKPAKDSDEPEVWRKPGRKQRGLLRPPIDSVADAVHKYEREEEDVPKFRMSHRYPKHRSRLKSDVQNRDEEPPSRRAIKYSRDRKDDVSDIDSKDYFHVDKDDFPDDKSKEFEEDVKFVTRRGNRRKPRDKFMKRTSSDIDIGYDEQEMEDNLRRTRPPDRHPERTHAPHAPRLQDRERYRPMLDDDDDDSVKVQPLGKGKAKPYEDYDDYYDMKRVNNIKSKLPSLLRRPTEGVTRTTSVSVAERELKAALGALGSRRSRKESGDAFPIHAAPPPSVTISNVPSFAPAAVSLETNRQWNDFIAANNSQRLQFSIYVTFLALINCLQIYEYSNISVILILTLIM